MVQPKYQYHVMTWGGFYNDEHKQKHGLEEGDFVFDTYEEREKFISKRQQIEKELNATKLMISRSEGYCCNTRTTLHRVISYKGVEYYSEYDLGVNRDYEHAEFFLEDKWFPGFNDYPLGEDFDYSKVEIISEWITGAFKVVVE